MKKTLLVLMLITGLSGLAQNGFGVKGGLNYSDNGKIEFTDVTGAGENIVEENADRKTGYHFGVFYRADLGPVFLKPELLYTKSKSSYKYNNESTDYDISKLDLPILVGIDILGPVNIFAGPSLQYILENDLQGISIGEVENDFTVGAQFGAGIQLGSIGIDVRYERSLTENQAEVLNLDNSEGVRRIDARPNQFIVSLSLNL